MGSAKLWSPYGAIGRRGGKLERTTRELCMIFFDELIIQKFHKSWNISLCSETHSPANTQDSLHEQQHFLLHRAAGLHVRSQMWESDKAFQQPSTTVTVRGGEWIGGHRELTQKLFWYFHGCHYACIGAWEFFISSVGTWALRFLLLYSRVWDHPRSHMDSGIFFSGVLSPWPHFRVLSHARSWPWLSHCGQNLLS